jgi:hypothetical protein
MNRKHFILTAALSLAASTWVQAAGKDAADAAAEAPFFGRLSISSAMKPEFVHAEPVQAQGTAAASAKPLVLHVRAGQEEHWAAHCLAYDACAVPVRIVTERWYRHVYLPETSQQDGSEQRYRDLVRPVRNPHEHRHDLIDESVEENLRLHGTQRSGGAAR